MATGFELMADRWLGTPDGSAPEGYSMFPYLDLAWQACGGSGNCPEVIEDEATARRVAGAIREDQHGVMPRIVVRPRTDEGSTVTVRVKRYDDGEEVGAITLPCREWELYAACEHPEFQWPEGLARAEDILLRGQIDEMGLGPRTVIFLED